MAPALPGPWRISSSKSSFSFHESTSSSSKSSSFTCESTTSSSSRASLRVGREQPLALQARDGWQPSVGSQLQACSGRLQLAAGCEEVSGELCVGRPGALQEGIPRAPLRRAGSSSGRGVRPCTGPPLARAGRCEGKR